MINSSYMPSTEHIAIEISMLIMDTIIITKQLSNLAKGRVNDYQQ
jgi:hypothetical protein